MTPQEFNDRLAAIHVHQMDGPPRAYFEIPKQRKQRDITVSEVWRFTYTVVWVLAPQSCSDGVLWQTLFDYLVSKLLRHPLEDCALIFWRCRPAVEITSDPNLKKLYGRLCIPGIDFSVDQAEGRDATVVLSIEPEGFRIDKSLPWIYV